jgi:hypothetical protein
MRLALLSLLALQPLHAQSFRQTSVDSYTRYELLAPGTASFRIIYDVSATAPGARFFFNPIRAGAEETVHAVYDLATGQALRWAVVDGAAAREAGMENANDDAHYIQAWLARPVPENGQARLRIDKTYRDAESYYADGDVLVFDRSLGIPRNSVVLPERYELVGANYPVQVDTEDDGRIRASFMHVGPGAVPLQIRARALPEGATPPRPGVRDTTEPEMTTSRTAATARTNYQFTERAFEDRDIVYFLQQPETHSFRLYHDYTESRPGIDRYVNIVRPGSRASDPEAFLLDTGEQLRVEQLQGADIAARGIDIGSDGGPEAEVVVIWFDPVESGESKRLRIWETYTDAGRYLLTGPNELVWDRGFGRARNAVVLPEGWYLSVNAMPAVITERDDGRIQLRFWNDRPDNLQVFVRARRK